MASSSKRERENERLRRARQEQRRAQQAARRRRQQSLAAGIFVLVAVIALAIVLPLTLGGSSSKKPTAGAGATTSPSPSASSSAAAGGTPVCDYVKDGTSASSKVSSLPPDTKASGTPTLTLKLTEGTVTATLDATKAPCTVNSFEYLAKAGYFDGTTCHRLTTSGIYVLQCGDPSGTGSGGPGYTIPDEDLTGATYPAGTIAMANTGQSHTGGSQFFLVYKDTQLPASYTPFGTITKGLDVLTGIAAKGTNNANGAGDGAPNETTKITSFTIG